MFNYLILNIMNIVTIQHLAQVIKRFTGEDIEYYSGATLAFSKNYRIWFDNHELKIFGNPTNPMKLAFIIELPQNSDGLAQYL